MMRRANLDMEASEPSSFFEANPPNLDYIFVKITTMMKERGSTIPNHANQFILHSFGLPFVWSKPRRSTLKINVDAALSPIYSSIDAVARDWRGSIYLPAPRR